LQRRILVEFTKYFQENRIKETTISIIYSSAEWCGGVKEPNSYRDGSKHAERNIPF